MEQTAKKFIWEVWGFQGVAYLVAGLRYFGRIYGLGWSKLAWDDALMFITILVYTAGSVIAYLEVACWNGLANNAMTDQERAALDPNSEEYTLRVNGSKAYVVGLLLYITLLWLLKGCWSVYYARLTSSVYCMRDLIRGAYIIMPLTYIACLLVAFIKCIPFDHQWQIYPNPGSNCHPAVSTVQTIFVMIMNTITDFYLMAIPIPMVFKSGLPTRQKLILLIMFSGGFLEMILGILRCSSILTLGDIEPVQADYWSVREVFVSVVLTNMPIVYPLVKRFFEKGLSSFSGSKSATDQADLSRGRRLGNNADCECNIKSSNRKHPLLIPNDTCWAYEDNIVDSGNAAKTTGTASSGESASALPLPLQGLKSNAICCEHEIGISLPRPSFVRDCRETG